MAPTIGWLDAEHRALDHALAEVEYLAERRSFEGATRRFAEFRDSFTAHLRDEEDSVFPKLVAQDPSVGRLLPQLKTQHAQLEMALEAVAEALAQADFNEFCSGLRALATLLCEHQGTEERLLMAASTPQAQAHA